jgi:YhgE/Pip-like protein
MSELSKVPSPSAGGESIRSLLRHPLVWIAVIGAGVLALVMTFAYVSAFLDPVGRLDGLPIGVVNQDVPVAVAGQQVAVGDDFVSQLRRQNAAPGSHPVEYVFFRSVTGALEAVGNNHLIGVITLPPTLSKDVAAVGTAAGAAPPATVQLYRNVGAGSLQPSVFDDTTEAAIDALSATASGQLTDALTTAGTSVAPANVTTLAQPIVAVTADAPPLGDKTGRGLPPFYIALTITLTALFGTTAIHLAVVALAGRGQVEVMGRAIVLRRVAVSRVDQYVTEALLTIPLAILGGSAVIWMSVGVLGAQSDHPKQALLFAMLGVLAMSLLTLAFLTAFGLVGDLLALLVMTIFGVPSARAVYPSESLPGFFRALGEILPLRWLTDGLRSLYYFSGRAEAGLRGAWLAIVLYALIGLLLGLLAALWSHRRSRIEALSVSELAAGGGAQA